jgi:hypothetical protein
VGNLIHRENQGDPFGTPSANGIEPPHVDLEHFLIQEQQGGQGLILGAGRDVPINRQVGQKNCSISAVPSKLGCQMPWKRMQRSKPVSASTFGSVEEVLDPGGLAHLFEELHGLFSCLRWSGKQRVELNRFAVDEKSGFMAAFFVR